MAEKKLKLWNGRLGGYKHGYIAAYSRADAVRLASEAFGLRGWLPEIRDYWSEGLWGNFMIGFTPRLVVVLICSRQTLFVSPRDDRPMLVDYRAQQQSLFRRSTLRVRPFFVWANIPRRALAEKE